MRSIISQLIIPLVIMSCLDFTSCYAVVNGSDTLRAGEYITTDETIISSKRDYELGFFRPQNSTDYYVGIWYKEDPKRTVLWVANRDYPVLTSSAVFTISPDGNLAITDGKMSYAVSTSAGNETRTSAKLLDSGNLVLISDESEVFWQSFDNPTDTLLPGMNLGYDNLTASSWSLVSWESNENPAPGNFTLELDSLTFNLVIMEGQKQYWTGNVYEYLGNAVDSSANSESIYLTWYVSNSSEITRLVLGVYGQLERQLWSDETKSWYSLNTSKCGTEVNCGAYSICNTSSHNSSPCCCLPGFRLKFNESTRPGCVRRTEVVCDGEGASEVGFFQLSNVVWPSHPKEVKYSKRDGECRLACLEDCSCSGYYFDDRKTQCLIWFVDLINMKTVSAYDSNGRDFNLKLPFSELENLGNSSRGKPKQEDQTGLSKQIESRNKKQVLAIVLLTSSLAIFTLALFVYYVKRRIQNRAGEDLLLFDLSMSLRAEESEFAETYKLARKDQSKEVKLPLFSFSSVCAATDNFSDSNKLGEGGFGPVYKGKLVKGDEIAVKRLSRRSGQGWEELKNEALLIAKLQHKNLVRLLGCCLERGEKILIYEYMPNKSLDFFLFDVRQRQTLDWETRARIIEGIAQGLLYLHQYSRFRIIHRDLKASNILLDSEMNPKIADFGMARLFGGNESEANTERIVGTFGYMPPEYALEGIFSVKSDVFSFGVLLLEIVSGRKNTGYYHSNTSNLLGYVWDLWTSNKGIEFFDQLLQNKPSSEVVLRYVNIGLLCVQDNAADRPNMSDVVLMLSNENMILPQPKQPGFLNVRSSATSNSSKSRHEISSMEFSTSSATNTG